MPGQNEAVTEKPTKTYGKRKSKVPHRKNIKVISNANSILNNRMGISKQTGSNNRKVKVLLPSITKKKFQKNKTDKRIRPQKSRYFEGMLVGSFLGAAITSMISKIISENIS
ncbi:hypothetical protein J7295_02032 [Nakaseomyces glabratus]|nr:hypothetical protein J7298_02025 [Nakaseomyces glabratus]KAH7602516.1 hypothetical protein J7295_02032 [Nakaseomyces glabratus]KAH7613906.1 hypothetical protein J7292_02007 [Nakaseomyces glabratus]